MKKLLNTAFIYLIVSVVFEVVTAMLIEAMRVGEVVGNIAVRPMALTIHTHLLVLGFLFFILVVLLEKVFLISNQKSFKLFYNTYNIGLIITVVIIGYRSFGEIFAYPVSKAIAMGVGTVGHIIITVGFFAFYSCVKNAVLNK